MSGNKSIIVLLAMALLVAVGLTIYLLLSDEESPAVVSEDIAIPASTPETALEPEPEPDENRLIIYSCYNTHTQNWTGEARDVCEAWGWVDDYRLTLSGFDGVSGDGFVSSVWYTGCLNRMRFAEDPEFTINESLLIILFEK